jgi:hypothetical protein
MALDQ